MNYTSSRILNRSTPLLEEKRDTLREKYDTLRWHPCLHFDEETQQQPAQKANFSKQEEKLATTS
jgi:hypothetical protein